MGDSHKTDYGLTGQSLENADHPASDSRIADVDKSPKDPAEARNKDSEADETGS